MRSAAHSAMSRQDAARLLLASALWIAGCRAAAAPARATPPVIGAAGVSEAQRVATTLRAPRQRAPRSPVVLRSLQQLDDAALEGAAAGADAA
eukprot:2864610-Prymnesium_polylepis.1